MIFKKRKRVIERLGFNGRYPYIDHQDHDQFSQYFIKVDLMTKARGNLTDEIERTSG